MVDARGAAVAGPADRHAVCASIVSAARAMGPLGLNQGTSGNVSVRLDDGLLITPSGRPYESMEPCDVVALGMDGSFSHRLAPSSEWRFHRDILLARPEIGAVVHAHPTYCTAFAMCRTEIPAVHYMVAAVGGPTIRCSGYAPYGTAELSGLALEALAGRTGCLLANHGMIATGPTLDKAMWLAVEMEALCRQYAVALQVGRPVVLPDDEIERIVERFRGYGLSAEAPIDGPSSPRRAA